MYPTLNNLDVVRIKNKKNIKRFDIVIFRINSDTNIYYRAENYFIKRIIALPGDSLKIIDGYVYINGVLLDEPYFDSLYLPSLNNSVSFDGELKYKINNEIQNTLIIPDGYYFVLGDNRENNKSTDSISFGLISEKQIIGVKVYDE